MGIKWLTHLHRASSWTYYATHPFAYLYDFYRDARACYQRAVRGWADSDVWNFDTYLTLVIYNGLAQLAPSDDAHDLLELSGVFKEYYEADINSDSWKHWTRTKSKMYSLIDWLPTLWN